MIVFVAYVLINGGVQNLLQPRLMGEGLISPVVVFISVFVWAWLLGGIGAILAVPLTLLIMEVLDSFSPSSWLLASCDLCRARSRRTVRLPKICCTRSGTGFRSR